MRKIISLIAAMLLCTTLLYPQAAIDVPFIFNSDIGDTLILHLGLDPTATSGIDPQLDEQNTYNIVGEGFDAMFDLTPYCGYNAWSYKDFRNAPVLPYSGSIQHRLIWQWGTSGATVCNMTYNLPDFLRIQIEDYWGGILFSTDTLYGSGSLIFAVPVPVPMNFNLIYTNALPVELTSFTGEQEGSAVRLNWTTASEINNKGFDVERKDQNSAWETLSFVEGYGTTTEIHSYSYTDDLSKAAVTYPLYYRLKQIDYDGAVSYSEELKIEAAVTPADFVLEQNYPNPFNPATSISYSITEYSNVNIKVFDILGNEIETLINEEKPAGRYEVTWNAADLPSGIYFYQLSAGSFVEMRKMVLLK